MDIRVAASTVPGQMVDFEDAMRFSGVAAGICRMPDNFQSLLNEPFDDSLKRLMICVKYGHHSVLEHVYFSFAFERIPKILAMVLNNEKVYATSEKSARHTKMAMNSVEGLLYTKWHEILCEEISNAYPKMKKQAVNKFAMENARYFISVFTPATTMLYTVSWRQLCYIITFMEDFIKSDETNAFSLRLKSVFEDFLDTPVCKNNGTLIPIRNFAIEYVDNRLKNRSLSLFIKNLTRKEHFGDTYCTNYRSSFAYLAQAQRHRTIDYQMVLPSKNPYFFVPPVIEKNKDLSKRWIEDMFSVADNYPQGMCVVINERGTLENFILKCEERLCGQAQLEIALRTKKIMNSYLKKATDESIVNELLPYSKGARCTFPDWHCTSPCFFGKVHALKRLV